MDSGATAELERDVVEGLGEFGISCDVQEAELMVRHLQLVMEVNRETNLTRIMNPHEAVYLHIVDSLLPLAVPGGFIDKESSFLDIGTGGGFPGIPYAVMTGANGVLVDSVGKKVEAVAWFLEELGLSGRVSARKMRVEEFPREWAHSFDRILVRAVAKTNVLIEYAAPLLRQHGLLMVEKGRPDELEIVEAREAARLCGMECREGGSFDLPGGRGHREILVYEKIRHPLVRLPRPVGTAKRNPLGAK